jgi:hypothetical protein
MGQHLNFQHSFWDVIQEVTYIIAQFDCYYKYQLVLFCAISEYCWKEPKRASIYVEITKLNKQLMHTLLQFVVSLQSRFYTLALYNCLDVNIFKRLFKSDLS